MAIGNLALGSGCSWGADKLNIPENSSAISTGSPVIGSDGSYTISLCLKCNSYKSANYNTSYIFDINKVLTLRIYINNYTPKLYADIFYDAGNYDYDSIEINSNDLTSNKVIDIVHTNNYNKIYINGQLASTITRQGATITPLGRLALACTADVNGTIINNGQCDLDVYALNIYNRELDPSEIETNFNTYNSRFNLGL